MALSAFICRHSKHICAAAGCLPSAADADAAWLPARLPYLPARLRAGRPLLYTGVEQACEASHGKGEQPSSERATQKV